MTSEMRFIGNEDGEAIQFTTKGGLKEVSLRELEQCIQKGASSFLNRTWTRIKLGRLIGRSFDEKAIKELLGNLSIEELTKIEKCAGPALKALAMQKRVEKEYKDLIGTKKSEWLEAAKDPEAIKTVPGKVKALRAKIEKKLQNESPEFQKLVRSYLDSQITEFANEYFSYKLTKLGQELSALSDSIQLIREGPDPQKRLAAFRQIAIAIREMGKDFSGDAFPGLKITFTGFREEANKKITAVFGEVASLCQQDIQQHIDNALKDVQDLTTTKAIDQVFEGLGLYERGAETWVGKYFHDQVSREKEVDKILFKMLGNDLGSLSASLKAAKEKLQIFENEGKSIQEINQLCNETRGLLATAHKKYGTSSPRFDEATQSLATDLSQFEAQIVRSRISKISKEMAGKIGAAKRSLEGTPQTYAQVAKELEDTYGVQDPTSEYGKLFNKELTREIARQSVKAGFKPFTTQEMVPRISRRNWERTEGGDRGYAATQDEQTLDQRNLELLLAANNSTEEGPIHDLLELSRDHAVGGVFQKIELDSEAEIFVRADLHSDAASLLAQLELLKTQGKLDANYKCIGNFHMIFLGDYMDRGINDIEVISLVLKLRMENPDKVHLIRGNHESTEKDILKYNKKREWIAQHSDELDCCYKTFPLALFVGGKPVRSSGRTEYMHFSHGAFSTLLDPVKFLEGKAPMMAVQGTPEISRKLSLLAHFPFSFFKNKRVQAAQDLLKAQRAEKEIPNPERSALQEHEEGLETAYMISEPVGEGTHESGIDQSSRGRGFTMAPKVMKAYSRAFRSSKVAIKGFVGGHKHQGIVYRVPGKTSTTDTKVTTTTKIIATTLDVGVVGGSFDASAHKESPQGLMYTVTSRMRDWKKQKAVITGEGKEARMKILREKVSVYEPESFEAHKKTEAESS
jgi:hypothetical protein